MAENVLRNGSFEEGWTDVVVPGLNQVNQIPMFWGMEWLEPGERLWDSNDEARGVPECVHKHMNQLPPNENPGGEDALILDGEWTYKMFNANAAWGAQLSQVVRGLRPGTIAVLRAPVQAHLHGDTDPWSMEVGFWVNGVGGWHNAGELGDRDWTTFLQKITVPADGLVSALIRVKSKYDNAKDFFIDNVMLVAEIDTDPPDPPDPPDDGIFEMTVPAGTKQVILNLED